MPIEKWQLFVSRLFHFGLYGLPISAILVTGYALVSGGRMVARGAAQVYGGPTEGVKELALRVRALALDQATPGKEIESLQGGVELDARLADGSESQISGVLALGIVELKLGFPHAISGPVSVAVKASDSGVELARGVIELRASDWGGVAEQRGGWLAPSKGALRVAIEAGVLAVPFQGALLIQVDAGVTLPIQVEIAAQGVEIFGQHTVQRDIAVGASRTLRLPIIALDHVATLVVRARSNGTELEWSGALPVVPGALDVVRNSEGLVIRSPIPREMAYLGIVSKTERISGYVVSLRPDDRGGAIGSIPFQSGESPLWGVISSEFDDQASGLVGWPLDTVDPAVAPSPHPTFDVRSRLLLDGLADVRARQRRATERVCRSAASYCFLAGLVSALLVFWRFPSKLRPDLMAPFVRQNIGVGSRLLAALCIWVGFSLLAVFLLWRV